MTKTFKETEDDLYERYLNGTAFSKRWRSKFLEEKQMKGDLLSLKP